MTVGTLIVWLTELSPAGYDPETRTEQRRRWCRCAPSAVLTDGAMHPAHGPVLRPGLEPAVRPPADEPVDGVTGFDGADCGPVPFGFDAVTVNV